MGGQKKIYFIIPVFNDWESFGILAGNIEKESRGALSAYNLSIIAVNDGSTDEAPFDFGVSLPVHILHLKINVGHQRAIAIGIQYVAAEVTDTDYVVVMDGDGEDRPEDIMSLMRKAEVSERIIFAQRKKRQESALFKIGYFFYKRLFFFLTGQRISFGNFSVIPKKLLKKVASQNNIWNHYSGGIIQSRIPYDREVIDRGKRYKGTSKMNFNSLIIHGLSAISVYFDSLSVRILRLSLYGISICLAAIAYVFYQKVFTTNAIPGWASSLILIILGIMLQLFLVTLIVLLLQLSSRKNIVSPNPNIYKDFLDYIEYDKNAPVSKG